MYTLVKKIHEKPKIKYECFNYELNYYYLSTQPNCKAKNLKEFKKKFFDDIIRCEEASLDKYEDDEDDEEEQLRTEGWYPYSLHCLGKEKFLKELERLYCTPLNGQWTNVYINLNPYYIDSKPHYAHVKFDKTPSIVELLYAHSSIWQNFYRNETQKDIDNINHHYEIIKMHGNRYTLIFEPLMAS